MQPGRRDRRKGGRLGGHRGGGAGRAWHCAAGGGTAFVPSWRPPRRTVPCMWMRPRRAPRPSPARGLGACGVGVGVALVRRADRGLGRRPGSGPGLWEEHGGQAWRFRGVAGEEDLRSRGRGPGSRGGKTLGGRGGGGSRAKLQPLRSRRSAAFLAPSASRPRDAFRPTLLKETGAGRGRRTSCADS